MTIVKKIKIIAITISLAVVLACVGLFTIFIYTPGVMLEYVRDFPIDSRVIVFKTTHTRNASNVGAGGLRAFEVTGQERFDLNAAQIAELRDLLRDSRYTRSLGNRLNMRYSIPTDVESFRSYRITVLDDVVTQATIEIRWGGRFFRGALDNRRTTLTIRGNWEEAILGILAE